MKPPAAGMRVAIVDLACTTPFYCAPLTQALRDAGLDAELASPSFHLEPDYLDGRPRPSWICDIVIHAKRPRPLRVAARGLEIVINSRRLSHAVAGRSYDVVHVEWMPLGEERPNFMQRLRAQCDRTGTLLVYTAHNVKPHDVESPDLRSIARGIDCAHVVIAHTEHVAGGLREEVGVKTPVEIVPHGPLFIDSQLPDREAAASRLGLDPGPVVLFFGLARPYKGLDLLAEAWPLVRTSFSEAKLVVVGRALDDVAKAHQRSIETLPETTVVGGYVSVKEMLDYYAVSDVVVFPYRAISQSGALMTAAGLGRPTVITPIDGLVEQTRGLRSVTVSREPTAHSIAEAMVTSLNDRHQLLQAALDDRRAIAESAVGWASVAGKTLEIYKTHSTRRPPAGEDPR